MKDVPIVTPGYWDTRRDRLRVAKKLMHYPVDGDLPPAEHAAKVDADTVRLSFLGEGNDTRDARPGLEGPRRIAAEWP